MPNITDNPPKDIQDEIIALRTALDKQIPSKLLDRNLLIATWSIRRFFDITMKWKSEEGELPKRDMHSILCIAEIIRRFDVIAVQEVSGKAEGLIVLMEALGSDWSVLLSDITEGKPGNFERKAFIFDTRRVTPTGLTGEYVIPQEKLDVAGEGELKTQFARTPYIASFKIAEELFTLVNVHLIYGITKKETNKEIEAIVDWLRRWTEKGSVWESNLIALGDFNISSTEDKTYKTFLSTGLYVPKQLRQVRRTIFDKGDKLRIYDQIAWFQPNDNSLGLSLKDSGGGGSFDFVPHVFISRGYKKLSDLSYYISDHLPLWIEFSMRD